MKKTKEKKYGRLHHISVVLGALVVLSGAFALVLVIWSWHKNQSQTIQALSQTIETMYSEEDMQTMLAGAVEEARLETEALTKEELLSDIKEQLASGKSTVSVLRQLYPNELVVVSNSKYHFVPIRDDLAKHTLTEENLVLSEDNELTYMEANAVVSQKGIDVSKYQGNLDWGAVAASGINFAIIRVGYRGCCNRLHCGGPLLRKKFCGWCKSGH